MSIIVAGPASKELAYNTAKLANIECIDAISKRFPDGEIKITIPEAEKLEDEEVIIIQSTYPPVNEHIMELLFMLGKVREHTSKITLIIPYMAYARQDREFLKGESVSINHLALLLDAFNVSRVVTVDIHSRLALSYIKNSINVSAIPLLAERFKDMDNVIIVSPDIGGRERAEEFAKLIGKDVVALPKHRDRSTGEVKIDEDASILEKIDGKDVIIIDDMISTGGSIIKASNAIRDRCNDIYVTCTHALLLDNAYEKIIAAGVKEIISTNTIPNKSAKVDVSSILRDLIC
ncbi:MAG: ribose-phosphate pyrophosphokinase [Candidatus Nitrosothermus koennekii]|nr:MAG: ribose-phosphate pyrophosphokinase [Candidatus Nitrosothermus koennekii]